MFRVNQSRVVWTLIALAPGALGVVASACSVGSQGVAGETEAGAPDATVVTDATASEDGGGSDATIGADSGLSADTGLADAPSDSQGQADTAPTVYCATTGTYDGGEAGALPDPSPQNLRPEHGGLPRRRLLGPARLALQRGLHAVQRLPVGRTARDHPQPTTIGRTTTSATPASSSRGRPASHRRSTRALTQRHPTSASPPTAARSRCACAAPIQRSLRSPMGSSIRSGTSATGSAARTARTRRSPDAGPDAGPDAAPPVFDFMGGCDGDLHRGHALLLSLARRAYQSFAHRNPVITSRNAAGVMHAVRAP